METVNDLVKRYTICYDQYGRAYRCNSTWYDWGRWVALGVIVVAAFALFFLCSLISARRRRKAGRQPYYGTGWAGRTPFGHGQAQYNPNYQTQQPQYGGTGNSGYNQGEYGQGQYAPPNYNQSQTGGAAQSYYGGPGQRDVELQSPQNTYAAGGDNVYTPPTGPPPNKR